MSVFIIAEAGVNHNGSPGTARKLIDAAAQAGADAIKFQTFKAERTVVRHTGMARYQMKNTVEETQIEMLSRLELREEEHEKLFDYCRDRRIGFLSSAFDAESITVLVKLGVDVLKVPSGEITDLPYLREVGRFRKRVLLSTGMSDMEEIGKALDVLTGAGTRKENITVLHCNTSYPTPYEDANLKAMVAIRKAFKVNVGYSDHTPGIEAPIAAVAMGARVIEKHLTLDRSMAGPDHKASLEPLEFKAMAKSIRNIEQALGDGVKRPTASEKENIVYARRSIVASANIGKGEAFTPENICAKRPGGGISPMEWDNVLGKKAKMDFKKDDFITL